MKKISLFILLLISIQINSQDLFELFSENIPVISQYQTVYDAMVTKPNVVDKYIQNKMLTKIVNSGLFSKAEFIDIFCTHSQNTAAINWHDPAKFSPIPTNSPMWTQYKGYTGNTTGTKYVKLSYIPSVDGIAITKTNYCVIIGIGTNIQENLYDFGVYDGNTSLSIISRKTNDQVAIFNNESSGANINPNINSIGAYAISRKDASISKMNKNTGSVIASKPVASSLVSKELYACAENSNGTASPCNKQIAYVAMFSYLSDYEISEFMEIMDEYLNYYNSKLINETVSYLDENSETLVPLTDFLPGNDEQCHPSVINLPIYLGGYKYWMANTPLPKTLYPADYSKYEVPCIWASNDGINWTVPIGLSNPIYPVRTSDFTPDPDLFYDNGYLYCFFPTDNTGNTYLTSLKTTDGITWNGQYDRTMPTEPLVSPAVIKIGLYYYIYYIDPSTFVFKRARSTSLESVFSNEEIVNVSGYGTDQPWHMDILEVNNIYWIQFNTTLYSKLYMAYSTDGLNFTVPRNCQIAGQWQNTLVTGGMYRPSMMKLDNGQLIIYFPGEATGHYWRTLRANLVIK